MTSRYETAVLGRPAKPVSYPAHIAGGVAGGDYYVDDDDDDGCDDDDWDGDDDDNDGCGDDDDGDDDDERSQVYLLEWCVWGISFGKPINDIFGW